jgi:hypothetical protein
MAETLGSTAATGSSNQRSPSGMPTNQRSPSGMLTDARPPAGVLTNARPAENLSSNDRPPVPIVLRVQGTRGVVVAWPRRAKGDWHPLVIDAVAAPTAFAFVSSATAAARGLVEGAVVVVAAITGGAAGAADVNVGRTSGAALRLIFVKGAGVSDGHVVLTPALRDRLGVTQGSRVTLTLLMLPENTPGASDWSGVYRSTCQDQSAAAPLLRLRPVIFSVTEISAGAAVNAAAGAGVSEPASADPGASTSTDGEPVLSSLAALSRPHRLALGLGLGSDTATAANEDHRQVVGGQATNPTSAFSEGIDSIRQSANATSAEADAAARLLLARWVEAQARFDSSGSGVPVATGTVLHFRLEAGGIPNPTAMTPVQKSFEQ